MQDLRSAVWDGCLESVIQFFNDGRHNDIPRAWAHALYAAAEWGHLNIFEFLFFKGAASLEYRDSSSGMDAMSVAYKNGHYHICDFILSEKKKGI
jgi:hypothetical protein